MGSGEFENAVELAKRIEQNSIQPTPFEEDVHIEKIIDFSPSDFEGLTYSDLLNLYERTQKIKDASKWQGLVSEKTAALTQEEKQKAKEAESKIKEITTTALESAKEIKKSMKEGAGDAAEIDLSSLEFETGHEDVRVSPAHEIEKEEEKPPKAGSERPSAGSETEKERTGLEGLEFETGPPPITPPYKPAEEPEEKKPTEPEIKTEIEEEKLELPEPHDEAVTEKPKVRAPPKTTVPPILQQPVPDALAPTRYEDIEEEFKKEWGDKIDDAVIKRKMLELTKALFKEKTTSRRSRIKNQIFVLKRMLGRVSELSAAKKTKVKAGKSSGTADKKQVEEPEQKHEYSQNLFDTLLESQSIELSNTKDKLASAYRSQIEGLKSSFYQQISAIPEDGYTQKKKLYENFVFELTSAEERLVSDMKKYVDFIVKKHGTEVIRFAESNPDPALKNKVDERRSKIEEGYQKEFEVLVTMIKKDIESVVDKMGHEILRDESKRKQPARETETSNVVFEINETDDGTLLYYLHSMDPETYKNYERKHISKQEALHSAKILMAREKGLSDNLITKYFGSLK